MALYRRVLAVRKDNFDARHLLGAVLCQKGDFSAGIELRRNAGCGVDAHVQEGEAAFQ